MCRIGREDNCKETGCLWHKVFGHYCTEVSKCNQDVKDFGDRYSSVAIAPKPEVKFRPSEDPRSFYTRKGRVVTYKRNLEQTTNFLPKRGHKVPEKKKYTEIPVQKKQEEEIDLTKIKTAVQDDWIKKIKIPNEKKF